MTTSTVHARTSPQADHSPGRYARLTAISTAAVTAANLGLYAVGRWSDATLLVDPGAGAPNHLIAPPTSHGRRPCRSPSALSCSPSSPAARAVG